jgi:7-carboxy-7-deazaguanine synthase
MIREENYSKVVPIIEAYPCLQSEGKLTGVPHLLIRTTGCVMRCQFSNTDFCDSWYTSWSPEKGKFSVDSIIEMYKKYPDIKHTMITGGSPTMHEDLLHTLCAIAKDHNHYITMETEGSKFIETKVDLISLSPKLTNSIPRVGTKDPTGNDVKENHVRKHEKSRCNYDAMKNLIINHPDYQLKPVVSSIDDMEEIQFIQRTLDIPNKKVWLMPAGGTADELVGKRVWLMEYCWQNGYNYTDRIHIVAYGDKRGV